MPISHAELQLRQPGRHLIAHPIPLTAMMLRTAIEEEAGRAAPDHWPSSIRIRTIVEADGHAATPETRAIATYLAERFASFDLPVVIRDGLLAEAEEIQVAQHQGRYTDATHNGIGQWSGATVLAHVDYCYLQVQGHLAAASIVAVETGEVLAQLIVEAPPGQWAGFLDTISARLVDAVLLAVSPRTGIVPNHARRREGWLITQ